MWLIVCFVVLAHVSSSNFVFVSQSLTWDAAETHCRSLKRNLASIHSAADLSAVKSVISSSLSASTEVWVGAKYFGNAGTIDSTNWQWTDYSPFEYVNWNPVPDLTRGQCLAASRDAATGFRNANCAVIRPAVCGHAFLGYYSVSSTYPWEATVRCGSNRLASIHSLADQEQAFAQCPYAHCWIGARWNPSPPPDGTTTWQSDGTNYGFGLTWRSGDPINRETNNCVLMRGTGTSFYALTSYCSGYYQHLCNPSGGHPQCNVRQVAAPLSVSEYPASAIRVEVDMVHLTMTISILVEMVGPRVTPVIDFTQFAGDMRNVTNCENRLRSDFRQVFWSNLWTDAHNPTGKNWHVNGIASNLMYPSTKGTKWTSTRLHCKTMRYTTTLTWNELYACRKRDGHSRSIEVIDTPTAFGMRGAVYLSAVSPVDPANSNNPLSDYYVKTLRQVPFQLQFSKSAHVSETINSKIVDISVIQEWVEIVNGSARVMFRVRTRSATSLRLTSASILNPPGDVVNPIMTPESGSEQGGCITETNAPGVCLQTWILSFDRQACPHAYTSTLTSRFVVECQTNTPGTLLDECNTIKLLIGNVSGVVSVEADIQSDFYDIFCTDVTQFEFVHMTLNLSSTLTGAYVDAAFPFAAGQSVFIHVGPRDDFSAFRTSNGIVSEFRLGNLWFCLGNGTGLVGAQPNGDGGCFLPSSVQTRVKVHDGATSAIEPTWTVVKHQTSPKLVFEIKFPPITSSAIFLHVQVKIVPVLSGIRRRLLTSGGAASPFYQSSHTTIELKVNGQTAVPPAGKGGFEVNAMEVALFSSAGLAGCLLMIGCVWMMKKQRSGLKREQEMAETATGDLGQKQESPL